MDSENVENNQNLENIISDNNVPEKNISESSMQSVAAVNINKDYEEQNDETSNDLPSKKFLNNIGTGSKVDTENIPNDQNLTNKMSDNIYILNVINNVISDKLEKQKYLTSNEKSLVNNTLRNIDTDSEEDNVENKISLKNKSKKRLMIIDSDSEDVPTPHNKSFDENLPREATTFVADKNGKIVPENSTKGNLMDRILQMCDPESSTEEEEQNTEDERTRPNKSNMKHKSTKTNEKSGKKERNERNKMSTKEAMQQRREIRSESQRMTREMNVSLPYHKPKTRTLKEFLERRPKFASAVPNETVHTSPAIALKMTKKQLEIISKNLSKREKQVEEYFKSESEPEEENEDKSANETQLDNESKETNQEKEIPVEIKTIHDVKENMLDQEKSQQEYDNSMVVSLENSSKPDEVAMDTNENEIINKTSGESNNGENLEHQGNKESSSVIILGNILVHESDKNQNISEERSLDQHEDFILESDQIIPDQSSNQFEKLLEKYSNQAEIEPFEKKKNITEILKEKLGDFKPKLSKTDDFINLDENVNKLMQRFIKHTTKKQCNKHNVHLDIVNVTHGEIHKEKLEIVVEDDVIPILEKPGERMKKLKDELENKIAEQRSKFWQERINGKQENEEETPRDKNEDSEYEDILDKIDEAEFTEIEDDEDGDEIIGEDDTGDQEMNDDDDGEHEKKKSIFVDNEAEESDYEEEDKENSEKENMQFEEMDVEVFDEENLDADDEDEHSSIIPKKKKKLRRIIRAFENDSDEEHSNGVVTPNNIDKNSLTLDTTETFDDLSAPTPYQKRQDCTPTKPNITQSKSDLGFLTPIIHLTGLQSLNSGSKFLHDSPVSPFTIPKTSPSRMSQSGPQKKLFCDDNISDSQMMDDLADICSGKFVTQTQRLESKQKSEGDNFNTVDNSESNISKESSKNAASSEIYDKPSSTTQDFLEICSGKFTGITQPGSTLNKDLLEGEKSDLRVNEIKNDLPKNTNYTTIMTSSDEIKNFNDEDDTKLISQLLDEDELERFKKKFESPEKQVGRKIFDSDDEIEPSIRGKNAKKYVSEDEEEEQDDISEDIEFENNVNDEDDEPQEVEYDSEENEITEKNKKMKIADFFEDEAELSESEWGSADEDEKDMDMLEFEEGDNEKLDERKVKRDLERIHMRRILDEDNHEVKLLQEILLDDGELHGTGREKQFKWRNLDNFDNNDENAPKNDDGEVYLDDENENEEKWRRARYEREIFLKKKQETSLQFEETTIAIESNSQIFKLGQAAIKRSVSNTPTTATDSKSGSPDFKSSFSLVHKKGSFLSRSEQVLARVAEFTTKTINPTAGGVKNSRNFVFHTVQNSTAIDQDKQKNVKKRKAADGTPAAIKKLRLNTISPAAKKLETPNKAKRLFANW